jgi:hypothetical protein
MTMISRLTDTPEENERPIVSPEELVSACVHDVGHMRDDTPMGWVGGSFYAEDGLLVLLYQKHDEDLIDPEDDEHPNGFADTGLGLLTVDRVVELVAALTHGGRRPAITNHDEARAWVLAQIERGDDRG